MIIYRIINIVNGNFYIGKTTKTLEKRFKQHCLNSKNNKTYFQKAMKKYGFENFKYEILEDVDFNDNIDEREKHWIKTLNPHYNMTEGGEGGDTSKSPNFIESIKNRKSTKNMTYEEIYGNDLASELKKSRSLSNKTRDYSSFTYSIKGKTRSDFFGEEQAKKIEEKRKKSYSIVVQQKRKELDEKIIEIQKDFIKAGLSRREYSKKTGINYTTLNKYLRYSYEDQYHVPEMR